MHPFGLERPRDLAAALALRAQAGRNDAPAEYIAGGTDMVQLLQEYVRRPERLVSLAGLLDNRIEVGPQGLRLGAANRWHAVLGTSENCIAVNASDLAVALVALDAAVEIRTAERQRLVPLIDFYRLPDATPHIETLLDPGEVVAAIAVPASPAARRSHYLKVRDRASFEFAVVSAAVALEMDGVHIRQSRIALGGVGTKPWRVRRVEAALAGASLEPARLRAAAALAAEGAQGRGHNDFKIELMQRAIVRAVETAGARA